jgi:hypothetical protein
MLRSPLRASAILAACTLFIAAAAPARAAMQGDAEAIAMARRLIGTMGGQAAWGRANWLYIRRVAWDRSRSGPVESEYWWRIDQPGEWARFRGPGVDWAWAWTREGGWRRMDGRLSFMDAADVRHQLGWWRGDINVIYGRLAREDEGLRLIKAGERSFRALDAADGSDLGLFVLDGSGRLARWKYRFGEDEAELVFGPQKAFGALRAPAWGATPDGSSRFDHVELRLSEAMPDISMAPPKR